MRAFFKTFQNNLQKLISELESGIARIEASANKDGLSDDCDTLHDMKALVSKGPLLVAKLIQTKAPGADEFVEVVNFCKGKGIALPRCVVAEHLRSLVAQHAQYEHYDQMPSVGEEDDAEFVMYAVEEVIFKLLRSIKNNEIDAPSQQCPAKQRAAQAISATGTTPMFADQNNKAAVDIVNCHTVPVQDLKAALDCISAANDTSPRLLGFFTKSTGHAVGQKLVAAAAQVHESRSSEATSSVELQRIKEFNLF